MKYRSCTVRMCSQNCNELNINKLTNPKKEFFAMTEHVVFVCISILHNLIDWVQMTLYKQKFKLNYSDETRHHFYTVMYVRNRASLLYYTPSRSAPEDHYEKNKLIKSPPVHFRDTRQGYYTPSRSAQIGRAHV